MRIRNAEISDLSGILRIYERARQYMRDTGNPDQWGTTYPQESLLREDISFRNLYVAVSEDGTILCVFFFCVMDDPTYRVIENGEWMLPGPYGVIHRIASSGREQGIASVCIRWCFDRCHNLRMDTHEKNLTMQHVLEKNGFIRCGIIHLSNGDPRITYQKTE